MPRRRLRWRSLVVAALVVGGCASTANPSPTRPTVADPNPFRIGRPLVIPHGGGDGMFPEDTLYAYQHSLALGGDVVDADVQTTADGIPIAFHDPTLDRTTNGKFPHTLVTLDLKDLHTTAVQPLCTLLRHLGRTTEVSIGVDTTAQVELFRSTCPEVRTSGTDADRAAMRAARAAHDASYTTTQLVSQPQFVGPDGTQRVTADSLSFSHQHDIAVLTWVVDDPAEMTQLIELGVDGIYTRHPDVLVALLHTMGRE